jgi:hypothetical protein
VLPAENVWEPLPLAKFVRDLQAVDTDAISAPVTNFGTWRPSGRLQQGSVYAMSGIAF